MQHVAASVKSIDGFLPHVYDSVDGKFKPSEHLDELSVVSFREALSKRCCEVIRRRLPLLATYLKLPTHSKVKDVALFFIAKWDHNGTQYEGAIHKHLLFDGIPEHPYTDIYCQKFWHRLSEKYHVVAFIVEHALQVARGVERVSGALKIGQSIKYFGVMAHSNGWRMGLGGKGINQDIRSHKISDKLLDSLHPEAIIAFLGCSTGEEGESSIAQALSKRAGRRLVFGARSDGSGFHIEEYKVKNFSVLIPFFIDGYGLKGEVKTSSVAYRSGEMLHTLTFRSKL